MPVTPIFLLSLPRSGSTFIQRVIAAHEGISTRSEPWVLLPLLDMLRRPMPMQSTYHASVAVGVEDFIAELPGGEDEYLAGIRELALEMYTRVADPGARFFLDKTVQYFLITDQLFRAFPDARFVYLWRNPLSVISSIVETLGQGRWVMAKHRLEMFHGVHELVAGYLAHRDRAYSVRYEDLIAGDEAWHGLMEHIGVPFEPAALERFTEVELEGRRGDKVGSRRYRARSAEPLDKWRTVLGNPVRVAWTRRYMRWIGEDRLRVMGYELEELLADLDALETRSEGVVDDCLDLMRAAGREIWRARQPDNRLTSSFRALAATGDGRASRNGAGPAATTTTDVPGARAGT